MTVAFNDRMALLLSSTSSGIRDLKTGPKADARIVFS